jgi:putative flippase GtrA
VSDQPAHAAFLRASQVGTIARFAAVGIGATLTYLGSSFLLLAWGLLPQLTNLVAFAVSTTASYLGHYFFTYRSTQRHRQTGLRFAIMTGGLIALCSLLHQALLSTRLDPHLAALAVGLAYPPLSFVINNLWVYAQHDRGSDPRAR